MVGVISFGLPFSPSGSRGGLFHLWDLEAMTEEPVSLHKALLIVAWILEACFSGLGMAGPERLPEQSSAVAHKEKELSGCPGGHPCPSTEDFMSALFQEAHVSLVQGKRVWRLTGNCFPALHWELGVRTTGKTGQVR